MARIFIAALSALLVMVLGVAPSRAQRAYITDFSTGQLGEISTVSDAFVGATPTAVSLAPFGVAVSPDGSTVYITNTNPGGPGNLSVVNPATGMLIADPEVGLDPEGVAVSPDGSTVYVANFSNGSGNTVSVISTATNTVTQSITVGQGPTGVAVAPNGTVYVTNFTDNTVSVISNNAVTTTIPVGLDPTGVAGARTAAWSMWRTTMTEPSR
jgi:YVTN family beta-propeller protein